ncbi:MAG: carboxyl transferase domain-containing protein, partial [Pseudomonadota bacterium]
MTWKPETDEIEERRRLALLQGGEDAIARHHAKGKLTVRERIDAVLDPGSFDEVGRGAGEAERDADGNIVEFAPANFVLGFGKIDGRRVIVGGEDFTLKGGSPTEAGFRKSVYAEDLAVKYRLPLVRLHEGAGGSVGKPKHAKLPAPVFNAPRFRSVAQAMATAPVASAALGAVAGLPAARLVSSHFSVMSKSTAQIMIAGPAVVERAMGEKLTKDELGGWGVHTKNGAVDNAAEDEPDAMEQIRTFLSYLPSNVYELAPLSTCDDPADRREERLLEIIPRDRRRAYDMRRIIKAVIDEGSFFEMGKGYGRSQITGLARMNGQPVAVWGNDPKHLAGAMTANGADKARRFMELAEVFH